MKERGQAKFSFHDRNAKNIVLHLSKHRDREWTRKELLEELKLDMTDGELEKKLKALVKTDIISQGQTNYDYRGVGDNIFDKVFRGVYEKEIYEFDVKVIGKEYREAFEKLEKQYLSLMGKYNYQKLSELKKFENIKRAMGFVFSRSGFTKDAEDYCREKGIACSEDERWLETTKLKSSIV